MSQRNRSERIALLRRAIARTQSRAAPGLATAPGVRRRLRKVRLGHAADGGVLGDLDAALGGGLRVGALHEIVAGSAGDASAASGFALALAARFVAAAQVRTAGVRTAGMRSARAHPSATRACKGLLWVVEAFAAQESGAPYAPGLAAHGLDPARMVLVDTARPKDTLWVLEEALRTRALTVVIGELWNGRKAYDLTASRRLLLAARDGGTPCLLVHAGAAGHADRLSSAADTRFEVTARPSVTRPAAGGLPLPGLPAWSVRLTKSRSEPGHAFDPDRRFDLVWDPEERCLHDEPVTSVPVSLGRPAVSRH